MDMKTEIAPTVSPAVNQSGAVAAEKTVSPAPEAVAAGSGKEASAAVQKVKDVLRDVLNLEPVADRELEIDFEKDLNKIVVKVFDKESGELIRQVPLPESISLSRSIRAAIRKMAGDQSGIAVDQEV